jgi:glycosyltransferase involved in cell wall biosynthesis
MANDIFANTYRASLFQTYNDSDYTLVNNSSIERTLEIARDYAAKDSRIHIYNNEAVARVIANHKIASRKSSPKANIVERIIHRKNRAIATPDR